MDNTSSRNIDMSTSVPHSFYETNMKQTFVGLVKWYM